MEKQAIHEPHTEKQEDMNLEEAFTALEGTIERLEQEDLSLEEAFQIYQKGMELLKTCNHAIDRVEKKVLVLNEEGEADEF